jgi:hypothetical protein
MKQLRLPSPAMVVALVALFAALAGTGYAATKLAPNSVGATQLKNHAVTKSKLSPSVVASMGSGYGARASGLASTIVGFAHVNAVGGGSPDLVESRNVTQLQATGVGNYRLTFDRPVDGCVVVATPSAGVEGGVPGTINAALATAPNAVIIRTWGANGALTYFLDFNVVVTC